MSGYDECIGKARDEHGLVSQSMARLLNVRSQWKDREPPVGQWQSSGSLWDDRNTAIYCPIVHAARPHLCYLTRSDSLGRLSLLFPTEIPP